MCARFPDLDLVFIESGGDNFAATFSPDLSDLKIYVIDVAGGISACYVSDWLQAGWCPRDNDIHTLTEIAMRFSSDIAHQRPGVLLLRFTVAGLMLFHGIAKLRYGLGPIEGLLSSAGLPTWIAYGALIGEVIAPLMVLAGVFVRAAALVIAFNMIVAVALAHPNELLTLSRTGGYGLELQAFYFFGALAIAMLAGRKPRS